jgi:hypothetical protein
MAYRDIEAIAMPVLIVFVPRAMNTYNSRLFQVGANGNVFE